MYDINVNFLKDRKLDNQTSGATAFRLQKKTPLKERLPMFIGGGVGLALIALTGGALLLLNNQKSNTQQQIAQLDAEIQRLQGQDAQIRAIQGEIDNANQQIGILVNVFEQIKPWSAILEELAAVTPRNIQIHAVGDVQPENVEDTGGNWLGIAGTADSYTRVNDYVLSLKNSDLIETEQVSLYGATQIDSPNGYVFPGLTDEGEESSSGKEGQTLTLDGIKSLIDSPNTAPEQQDQTEEESVSLPQVVAFRIDLKLTDEPSPELINLLNRRGAIGLVSRLNRLRSQGALAIETDPIVEETTPTEQ